MLRKIMIGVATAAVLTGGLTVDAFAAPGGGGHGGGGGAHIGGGFGGAHMGGGFGGAHLGGGYGAAHLGGGFGRTRGYFDHDRGFRHRLRFGPGYYDYGCNYGYPYYHRYSCYTPEY
jgi:hypothetical protein